MSVRFRTPTLLSILLILSIAACTGRATLPSAQEVDTAATEQAAYTQAAETIVAELTLNAPPTATATPVLPTEMPTVPPPAALPEIFTSTPTFEPLPPTSTLPPPPTATMTETPLPTFTLTPQFTFTSTMPPEMNFQLVYKDNFSSDSGWPVFNGEQVYLRYAMGGYVVVNKVIKDAVWGVRNLFYPDVRIEVTGSRLDGPLDGYYGIICNFADGSNYHILAVGSDGWYGIGKQKAGELKFLHEAKDTTGTVNTGNAPNLIRADCIGTSLVLWVNGVRLAEVQDTDFTAGAVGVAAGTRAVTGYEALFDDFMIYTPVK